MFGTAACAAGRRPSGAPRWPAVPGAEPQKRRRCEQLRPEPGALSPGRQLGATSRCHHPRPEARHPLEQVVWQSGQPSSTPVGGASGFLGPEQRSLPKDRGVAPMLAPLVGRRTRPLWATRSSSGGRRLAGSGGCSPGEEPRGGGGRSCGSAGGVPSAQRPAATGPLSAHPEALLGVLGTEPERLADGVPTDAAGACFGHLAAHVGLHSGQGRHGPLQQVEQ